MNEILQKKLKLFENHVCRTCAFTGQIKYYNIIDNFITYQTVHVPFTEIIRFVLDIEIHNEDGKSLEICESCKNKLLDFYYFRKRSQLIQIIQGSMGIEDINRNTIDLELSVESKNIQETISLVKSFVCNQKISFIEIKSSDGRPGLRINSVIGAESNSIVPVVQPRFVIPQAQNIPSIFNRDYLDEHAFDEPPIECPPLNVDGMIVLKLNLTNSATLERMLELEEKTIMPAFRRNKTLTDSEKDTVCRAIIKCVLKSNPTKLLKRHDFNMISKVIVDLFEEKPPNKVIYFRYFDMLKAQFSKFRNVYSDAGIYNVPARNHQCSTKNLKVPQSFK